MRKKGPENTLTYGDILEIPSLLRDFRARFAEYAALAGKSSRGRVYLVGRGSSGNATLFAKYVWEEFCGVVGNIIHPYSVFSARKKMDFGGEVVWAFSQSGKSADIARCLGRLVSWGARGVAVTNEPDIKKNLLAKTAGNNILLSSSREVSVAATKSFALQLWASLNVAEAWGAGFSEKDFEKAISEIEKFTAALPGWGDELLEKIRKRPFIGFVGRGPFNAVAEDSALKFREMAGFHSLGYSAAEFLHGPIGAFSEKDFVFLLSRGAGGERDILKVGRELEKRGTDFEILSERKLRYPFNALLADIKMKFLALRLAVDKGLDPDRPKGLKKVTRTF